jgi:hypothetical protein
MSDPKKDSINAVLGDILHPKEKKSWVPSKQVLIGIGGVTTFILFTLILDPSTQPDTEQVKRSITPVINVGHNNNQDFTPNTNSVRDLLSKLDTLSTTGVSDTSEHKDTETARGLASTSTVEDTHSSPLSRKNTSYQNDRKNHHLNSVINNPYTTPTPRMSSSEPVSQQSIDYSVDPTVSLNIPGNTVHIPYTSKLEATLSKDYDSDIQGSLIIAHLRTSYEQKNLRNIKLVGQPYATSGGRVFVQFHTVIYSDKTQSPFKGRGQDYSDGFFGIKGDLDKKSGQKLTKIAAESGAALLSIAASTDSTGFSQEAVNMLINDNVSSIKITESIFLESGTRFYVFFDESTELKENI